MSIQNITGGESLQSNARPRPTSPIGEQYDVWKPNLYQLQLYAPCPNPVTCLRFISDRPKFYGGCYHGKMSHTEAAEILTAEGSYLIRQSENCTEFYTLTLRFNGKTKHYKLYYDGQHYVKDKRFDSVFQLVADGLVTLHMELHAGSYIEQMYHLSSYEKSPYMTLNKLKRKVVLNQTKISNNGSTPLVKGEEDPDVEYEKPHAFKLHTFKGLNWCEMCGNFMWGFTQQGVKCEDCGFSAHAKCSEKVPPDCCPDLKQIRGVFGINLTTVVKSLKTLRPFVVDKCINEIERRGLDSEGLYRVSGFAEEIEALKIAFDKDGETVDLGPNTCENINVIAGTLKLYLRLLPLPLISHRAHPVLIEAAQQTGVEEQVAGLRRAYQFLDPAHYNTLQYLMAHLARVAAHSATNKMTAHNLSTVFAPTLMPGPILEAWEGGLPAMTNEISALEMLITHHHLIF